MNHTRNWRAVAVALAGVPFVRGEVAARDERRTPVVEAVEKTKESIVTLKMTKRGNWGVKEVNGCGVIVDSRGYVVTSQHVITGCEKLSVVLHDDTEVPARIYAQDEKTDLAVIRVEGDREL